MTLSFAIVKEIEKLAAILYAKHEGKKTVFYRSRECIEEWTRGDSSKLSEDILKQSPVHFTMNDGYTYIFDKVVWV